MLQLEEATQEPQLDAGELRHVGAVFSAGQYRAQRDHQHLKQIVPRSVARPRIIQARKAGCETVHRRPRVVTNHTVVESIRPEPGNRRTGLSSKFHMRFPCSVLPFRSTSVSIRPIMARSGNTGSPG